MNFKSFVKWFKDNMPVGDLKPMYFTETKNTFMVSRSLVQEDSLDTYMSVTHDGYFVNVTIYADKQQDQKFVSGLEKEHKNQLKGMFPCVKVGFLAEEADEKAKQIFDAPAENVTNFLLKHKENFVWTLPIKERKKR